MVELQSERLHLRLALWLAVGEKADESELDFENSKNVKMH
jgi:hypothetical protein